MKTEIFSRRGAEAQRGKTSNMFKPSIVNNAMQGFYVILFPISSLRNSTFLVRYSILVFKNTDF